MLNLYKIATKREQTLDSLTDGEVASVIYHDLFDFPLNFAEILKWTLSEKSASEIKITSDAVGRDGYYFLEGKEGIVYKRTLRNRISAKKMEIAKSAAKFFSFIPSVKMIAITGSLAMQNATDESDIDLLIVSKRGMLWTTRLACYMIAKIIGVKTRKSGDKNQKDKLCLNMWLDESDLVWQQRNVYTAHEIAQVYPLINKDKTYEKFIYKNKWVKAFWPNAVKIRRWSGNNDYSTPPNLLEKIAYEIQLAHMKSSITREVVTSTRALFHPHDWGKIVMSRLGA